MLCANGVCIILKRLYEIDKIETINNIKYVSDTIIKRLYSSFDSIESEAQLVEEKAYQKSSQYFDPETMDETHGMEEAFHQGVSHYIVHTQMKQEFINSSITWLFHQFERDCTRIFQTEDGNKKKDKLAELNLNTSLNSPWKICNKELRDLANAIKHGEGNSLNRLKPTRPDLFKKNPDGSITNEVVVTTADIEKYTNTLLDFWGDFFNATIPECA
jgi:hypothetical protein